MNFILEKICGIAAESEGKIFLIPLMFLQNIFRPSGHVLHLIGWFEKCKTPVRGNWYEKIPEPVTGFAPNFDAVSGRQKITVYPFIYERVNRYMVVVRLAAHVSKGCKSPNPPGRGKDIAEGKGVHREVESEGSWIWGTY